MKVAILVIFLFIGIFYSLLIALFPSYSNVLFILSRVVYDPLHLLSKNIDHQGIIQETNAQSGIKNGNNSLTTSRQLNTEDITVGLWTPMNNSFALQHLEGEDQKEAIDTLLNKGYQEYYYVMNNFEDPKSVKLTESLLKTANKTKLKIIIILLPPSEGGSDTSYDWDGWIRYFNSLKKKYPSSFEGFTIDDFNWISTKTNTKFKNNIDFMEYTMLSKSLEHKSKDVKFYPTIYFEGKKTGIIVKKYNNFIDGLVVASGCYYNISILERQLDMFSEIFKKPMRYIVYPTITYNYSRLDYSPPMDRLIMATLSIASKSSHGLIVWRDLDNPVIQEHMRYRHDKQYLLDISNSKQAQIKEEMMDTNGKSKISKLHTGCSNWAKKYNEAYDKWINSPKGEVDDKWKKTILH
ncbi:MAG: hypothetical protein WAL53_07810 [Nitrososphaeraceae archaeon]